MLQYYYFNSKGMRGVVNPLKRIANRGSDKDIVSLKNKQNKRDLNAAMKAANKLKGSQKKFVVNSLKQLKKITILALKAIIYFYLVFKV